jgi:hypothetical protein
LVLPLATELITENKNWHVEDAKTFAVDFKDYPSLVLARQKLADTFVRYERSVMQMKNLHARSGAIRDTRMMLCRETQVEPNEVTWAAFQAICQLYTAITVQEHVGFQDQTGILRTLVVDKRVLLQTIKVIHFPDRSVIKAWAAGLLKHQWF